MCRCGSAPGSHHGGAPALHVVEALLGAASWDASLAPAMQARGLAIPEEAAAAALLEDLKRLERSTLP